MGLFIFAGYKTVGECVDNPLMYYYSNLLFIFNLANIAIKFNISRFVFSSSPTVYVNGQAPFLEDMPLLERTNPYGEAKAINVRILSDMVKPNANISVTLLRFFNPFGAHQARLIGEVPDVKQIV